MIVLRAIQELAAQGTTDAEIARILAKEGHRKYYGHPYTRRIVCWTRWKHGVLQTRPPREPNAYNLVQAAERLGVSITLVRHWIRDGLIKPVPANYRNELKVTLTDEDVNRLLNGWDRDREWGVTATAKYLGIPKWQVYYLVRIGTLKARRGIYGTDNRVFILVESVKRYVDKVKGTSPSDGSETTGTASPPAQAEEGHL